MVRLILNKDWKCTLEVPLKLLLRPARWLYLAGVSWRILVTAGSINVNLYLAVVKARRKLLPPESMPTPTPRHTITLSTRQPAAMDLEFGSCQTQVARLIHQWSKAESHCQGESVFWHARAKSIYLLCGLTDWNRWRISDSQFIVSICALKMLMGGSRVDIGL